MREFTTLTKDGNCLLLGYSENTPSRRFGNSKPPYGGLALHSSAPRYSSQTRYTPRSALGNIKAPEGALIFRSLARPAQRFSNF